MMGISNQDLVFKLKSIGVRVEGDDAHIDTDIIQAILQGKKLPHPREVILRDEQTPPEAARRRTSPTPASVARRPAANPLRPQRPRTLIQRVEPRIQTMPVSERPAPAAAAPAVFAEAVPQPAEPPPPRSGGQRRRRDAGGGAAGPHGRRCHPAARRPLRRPVLLRHRPAFRPAPSPSRPGSAPAAGRPAPLRPGQQPAAPTALATQEQKRRAVERQQEQIERDKRKKGAKKPGPRLGPEADLTGFKGGTLEDLEGEEEVAAGAVSGRRRRRAQRKEDEERGRQGPQLQEGAGRRVR